MADALLTVRGITRRFGDRTILSGIDLDVAAGEAVGVVGPNGSGKSTLLRCIVGADEADDGEAFLAGRVLDEKQPEIRRDLAVVMDDIDFFPDLSVVEHISDEEQTDDEGCLSIPGLKFPCTRPLRARATGFNVHGEPVVIDGERLLARAVLHEIDHLDGVLFVDRLDSATRKAAMKAIREAEWAGAPAPVIKVSPHPSPFGL